MVVGAPAEFWRRLLDDGCLCLVLGTFIVFTIYLFIKKIRCLDFLD